MSTSHLEKLNQAMALQVENRLDDAEAIYKKILEEDPECVDAIHLLGLVFSERDQHEEAVDLIEKAIGLNPNAAAFHHNIAGIYRRLGRLEEAEAEFRRAIALKPDYGEAYQGLSEMVTFRRGDPFLDQVLVQLASPELEDRVRCYFHFAAGKCLDDIGEYAAAFEQYRQGNKAADKPFDSAEFRALIKDTIYVFNRAFIDELQDSGNPSEQPVFIVGMPRSGTTLVEQILASHSSVFGAGELSEMRQISKRASQLSRIQQPWPNCVPGLNALCLGMLADDYLGSIAGLLPSPHDRVVDKHPLNFQFVGLILLMFPRARVIHSVRDPLDTCISCFFQNFTKGQHYSFDLVQLAHFYNDYRRLMEHWEMLFPGRILTVEYERLLNDQETETRRLLDFCGLAFEPACLEFHKTSRAIKTASFLQVRKPIYKSSMQRWRRYSHELEEVAEILGITIDHPVTITGVNSILG